jgi:hypothetical protein
LSKIRLAIGHLTGEFPAAPAEKEYRDSIPNAPATPASQSPIAKHKNSFLRLFTSAKLLWSASEPSVARRIERYLT